MGMRKIAILTCDKPGCNARCEVEEDSQAYQPIGWFAVSFGPRLDYKPMRAAWEGYLCDGCTERLRARIEAVLPPPPPPPARTIP